MPILRDPKTGRILLGSTHDTTKKAEKSPTVRDIAWAAGIYEGEGNVTFGNSTAMLTVVQKDPFILYRLAELFGGTVSSKPQASGCYTWKIFGGRARGFLYTVFTFLSPRRRLQARKVLPFAEAI